MLTYRLGMHTIKERPVVVDGQIVIRPIMVVALTYDHRLLDGREAVTFLGELIVYCTGFLLFSCFACVQSRFATTSKTPPRCSWHRHRTWNTLTDLPNFHHK